MKGIKNVQLKKTIAATLALLMALAMVAVFAVEPGLAVTNNKGSKAKTVVIKEPKVSAGSFIVMSGSTSEVVYDNHAERKMSMGDITKLMTAMVVIDNIHDNSEYSNLVEIKSKVNDYGDDFREGDRITVEDLLKAMLVGGSDEAAEALARYSKDKRKTFISEMNSKAVQIGLSKTHYTNPTGLYNAEHYSTALDSAVCAQYAIRYAEIKELMNTDMVTIAVHGKKKDRSKTFSNEYVGSIAGVMEHPYKSAQYAGVATREYMQFVVVILDGAEKALDENARDLLEYGNYKATKNNIVKADKCVGHARVRGGAKTRVKAYTETKGFAYIPPEGSTDLVQTQVFMNSGITAPLKAGDKVGEYRIYVADELKGTVDLIVKKDVPKGWLPSKIYISNLVTAIVLAILALLAAVIIRLRAINKRKARIQARKRKAKVREMAERQAALDEDRRKRKWTYSNYYDAKDINDALNRRK